ncbi:MAG: HAMP domain-containing sensor histidine kinase [Xenococcaceae cyanobacterium MO_167.B27]|nr:HAMP domain-containing sensor histidine kinase [Xenococcaceae cyanobacterium MO_167.B27]
MRKFLIKQWLFQQEFFWEARTRIFAWYLGLSSVFIGLSIPIFSHLAVTQVDRRIEEDLGEEIEAFEKSLKNYQNQDIKTIFDRFLEYKIPGDKTFLIAIAQGQFYRSSPVSLPEAISPDSRLITKLAQTKSPLIEHNQIQDPEVGDILYTAEPVEIQGIVQGVLIVANIPQGERREALSVIVLVIKVLVWAFVLAIIAGWGVAGQVLHPVRSLIKTANAITEEDLTQRIPLRGGTGEMAELAKTFNNMMNRLEAAFKTQREFLNDASHEIRTPITIIRGHLELLEYSDAQERAETIALVLDELDRMSVFVEDLLLLARAERRDFLISREVDLSELTGEIFLKIRALGERKWRLDSQGKGTVNLDRQRIIQAIMNLAQNAVQHTNSNDIITFGSAIENKEVYFWVRDTGIGIPIQDQERIFQKFIRSSNSRNANQGTGLGLSVVSAIAQSHHGHVELYSQLGKGSMFVIVVPKKSPVKRHNL